MNPLLEQAALLIKEGNIEKGKQLLLEVLRQDPKDENAWLWMSRCVSRYDQKKECFERVLKINPQNQYALEGLTRLNQQKETASNTTNNLSSISKTATKSKSNNTRIYLIIIVLLFVCGICVAGGVIFNLIYSSGGSTNKETVSADHLVNVMQGRGYSFAKSNSSDGSTTYLGKSANGTGIVTLIANGAQLRSAVIVISLPYDDPSTSRENGQDMETFLSAASPGWDSTTWLLNSIKQILGGGTTEVQTTVGNADITLTFSNLPILTLQIIYR